MQIRCASCGRAVTIASTGVLPDRCPHCEGAPAPERLGRYRIERLLAAGGMGEVYLARHEELGTKVAIKLLPPPVGTGADAEALRERFAREARLTAAIEHPGVVRVYDCDVAGDRPYLVLEYLSGKSLRSRLRTGPLPVAEAVRIAADVADVLAAAHARAVLHRDIKPDNVLLDDTDRVRVLDFGIARALQDAEPITRTGEILGTPEYMAPEQLLETADEVDERTDVHALGVLTHELLTGRSPFAGSNLFQALKLVESLVPPPPSSLRAEVPAAVDAVVMRALQKDRAERFASAAELGAALRASCPAAGAVAGTGTPSAAARARWPVPVLGGLAVLLAVALVVVTAVAPWRAQADAPGDAAGDAPGDVTSDSPAATIAALLETGGVLDPLARERLRAAARALDTREDAGGDRAALYQRGRARLRLGAFTAALADLDRALLEGEEAAREPAAVAWYALHALLPALVEAPAWLAAADRRRRDRLLQLGGDASGATAAAGVLAACRALAAGDPAAAWKELDTRADDPEVAAMALLAARRACADDAAFRRLADQCAPALRVWPELRALVAAGRDERIAALAEGVAARAPESADRWLLELLRAYADARGGSTPPDRLTAAGELAWLTGAGMLAPIWLGALRLELAGAAGIAHIEGTGSVGGVATSLADGEAERLLRWCADADTRDHPAVVPLRALLQLVLHGPEAAERELAELPAEVEPPLSFFAAWRAAAAGSGAALELDRGVAWLMIGRTEPAVALLSRCAEAAPELAAAAALLRASVMPPDGAPPAAAALPNATDTHLLLLVPRPPDDDGSASAAIRFGRAALQAGVEPVAVLPLLRAAAAAGADMVALLAMEPWRPFGPGGAQHAAYLLEVCGGLH